MLTYLVKNGNNNFPGSLYFENTVREETSSQISYL